MRWLYLRPNEILKIRSNKALNQFQLVAFYAYFIFAFLLPPGFMIQMTEVGLFQLFNLDISKPHIV